MNAKKIMGAVLVALLAAALFVGAGAAGDAKSVGTVFVYQETGLSGTWTGDAGSVTFVNGVVAGENIKEGVYTNESGYSMYLTYPTAVITGLAANKSVDYSVVGGTLYTTADYLNLTAISPAGGNISDILITFPNGVQKLGSAVIDMTNFGKVTAGSNWENGILCINMSNTDIKKFGTGEFKLQAVFSTEGPGKSLVSYIPNNYLVAKDVYTITIVSEEKEATISASVDKVLAGKAFSVTVTGQPGKEYELEAGEGESFSIISAGANTMNGNKFDMPNSGSITIFMNTTTEDEITISVKDTDAEVTIEVLEPTLTATLGAPSYFIGEKIEVTLTTDGELADNYKFNITGTNYDETTFTNAGLKTGKDNVYELKTADLLKKLDVGTYTIKIYTDDGKTLLATLPVVLKQPFISIVEAPEVVVQGDKAEFIINAEATVKIQYYVFGTNYFLAGNTSENVDKDTKNQFVVTLTKDNTSAKNMSTGQYFAVFQHSMYDGLFNINATEAGSVQLYSTTKAQTLEFDKVLFNVSDRQTANAAQALCDALDSQNIDDMYVKASFFVVGKDASFTISEIPTTIAQGETLTISGVSTANADGTVTVEMISTAFAAVPKETVGSAAFIAVSTKVAEDGTWEITMDTSDLNVDEYSLKVAVTPANGGETETWKNVNINVVEADEPVNPEQPEEPEQPEQPEEPVAPATPGFGALAALAGLGAVAVLLLRRE